MPNYNDSNKQPNNKMVLIGKGEVTANPDLALLRLGVQTSGDNVTVTQAENAQISQNVLSSLQQLGVTDIKTAEYQIEKVFDYQNGNRIDKGYSVRNILDIRLSNLNLVGPVIDTAVYNGANVVEFIRFTIAQPDLYYQQALNLAVNNTYKKAKSIATSMGLMINPIPILITENSMSPTPFSPMFAAREGAFTTPIEPGTQQIEAMVTVEFLY